MGNTEADARTALVAAAISTGKAAERGTVGILGLVSVLGAALLAVPSFSLADPAYMAQLPGLDANVPVWAAVYGGLLLLGAALSGLLVLVTANISAVAACLEAFAPEKPGTTPSPYVTLLAESPLASGVWERQERRARSTDSGKPELGQRERALNVLSLTLMLLVSAVFIGAVGILILMGLRLKLMETVWMVATIFASAPAAWTILRLVRLLSVPVPTTSFKSAAQQTVARSGLLVLWACALCGVRWSADSALDAGSQYHITLERVVAPGLNPPPRWIDAAKDCSACGHGSGDLPREPAARYLGFQQLNARQATLDGAVFAGKLLIRPDFRGASLVGADFTQAIILGGDFRGAQLRGASFHQAFVLPDSTPAAVFRYMHHEDSLSHVEALCPTTESEAGRSRFARSGLQGADFTGAVVCAAQFDAADASAAQFDQNSVVVNSTFTSTSLERVGARGALFAASSFHNAMTSGAAFDGAVFVDSEGGRGSLASASLSCAAIIGGSLAGAVSPDDMDDADARWSADVMVRSESLGIRGQVGRPLPVDPCEVRGSARAMQREAGLERCIALDAVLNVGCTHEGDEQ